MSTPPAKAATRLFGRDDGTGFMVVATALAAAGAYLFQLAGGRVLGAEAFAPVAALWTVQFLLVTILLLPVEQITIRRLRIGGAESGPPTRLIAVTFGFAAAGLGVFTALTIDEYFEGQDAFAVLAPLLVGTYASFMLGRGHLAGNLRYRDYGGATLAESLSRLVVAAVVLAVGMGAVALGWAMVVAPLSVFAFRPWRDPEVATRPMPAAGRFLAGFVAANASAQTILAAGPLVVGALGATPTEFSVFFVTFLLFRAPLTLSYSLMARILPEFTALVAGGSSPRLGLWARRIAAVAVGLGAIAFVVGYFVGPGAVAVLFGDDFRPSPVLAALAASGVILATAALVVQQTLVARGVAGRQAAAWALGLAAAAVVVIAGGGDHLLRTGWAFLAGEGVALAGLVAGASRY